MQEQQGQISAHIKHQELKQLIEAQIADYELRAQRAASTEVDQRLAYYENLEEVYDLLE